MTTSIRYTEFDVPHVTADSHRALGFGVGWANAEQHIGLLAERWVTLRGDRSTFFGPEAPVGSGPRPDTRNLDSDLWWRRLAQDGIVRSALRGADPLGVRDEVRALVSGFVEGYNGFLAETGADRLSDDRVRGRGWVGPISDVDVYHQALHWNIFRSSGAMIPSLVSTPPETDGSVPERSYVPPPQESNMAVFGREMTGEPSGMLFANPHWYWYGADSFREIHLTIPGELDVYGSMVPGLPFVMTGFTPDVAFAGTSSFSQRFTLAHLRLDRDDPTRYRYSGGWRRMTAQTVSVPLGTAAGSPRHEHVFWSSHHGPVISSAEHPWSRDDAYAMRDVALSVRWLNQQYAVMASRSLAEIDRETARYMAVGWRNLMAVDSAGGLLYADRTAVPHVTDAQVAAAEQFPSPSEAWEERVPTIVDGASPEAEWGSDADAPVPGIFGASSLPSLRRTDYLANQNDTHWMNSPRQRLEGFPAVLGPERTSRTLRTRFALTRLEEMRESRRSPMSTALRFDDLRRAVFDDTVWSAELWRDTVISRLRAEDDAELDDAACVLNGWDGTDRIGSRGAALWRAIFFRLWHDNEHIDDDLFAEPFDVGAPITTPRGLRADAVVPAVRAALGVLRSTGTALDAAVESIQYIRRGDRRLALPGGPGATGQYDLVENSMDTSIDSWPHELDYGTGFLLWVRLDASGARAESILTYSQVDDPSSPHHVDQTELYRAGGVKTVRFRDEDVERHTLRRRVWP